LGDVLNDVKYIGSPDLETEISFVTSDSRKVQPGCVYAAIKGLKFDGHSKAGEALEKGSVYVVCERDLGIEKQLLVESSRSAYALMCANFQGNPSRKLKLAGVTGTNGKTTVANIVRQALEHCGHKTGMTGTIENIIGDVKIPAKNTTPDPAELHALFGRMVKAGCEFAVMETSSHAFDQHRLDGCFFNCGIFTNLTQDHLDYHGTMENYYQAKKKLFAMCATAIINYDDEYGRRLIKELSGTPGLEILTFSVGDDSADYTARSINRRADGVDFALVGSGLIERISFPMPGLYSVSNAMAAAVCCMKLGLSSRETAGALAAAGGVRGRIEIIPTGRDFTVICDYAHSPDGLQKVLSAVKEFARGRVLCLFGCAGNRDAKKRPLMAKVVGELADFAVLTSDNPRSEDPELIIEQASKGLDETGTPYVKIADRYQAIKWALENARRNDIIVLAGKGHEDYQVLAHGTIVFDEHAIVRELLGM
jgi:UDP-N-acetylmuramoyl-L-alanyl-D-glutamate--2,6-diaminopimelate ligase